MAQSGPAHDRLIVATFAAAAGLAGLAFAIAVFGTPMVDPASIDWLMHADRAQGFLGWEFYRNEPETFPLGQIRSLLAPVGASLAYTDAIPWLAIVLKPLSPVLPPTFQFAGLWIALGDALQGVFGFLILQRLLDEPLTSFAGSLLIIISPVLLHRKGHISLCGQWLLLAALLAYVATRRPRNTRSFLIWWAPLIILACGTHPYLAMMIVMLACAASVDGAVPRGRAEATSCERRRRGTVQVGLRLICVLVLAAVSLYAFDYFGDASPEEHGFGLYSANLLSLVDPREWSTLVPELAVTPGEYEGFGFAGSGVILVVAIAAILRLCGRRPAATAAQREGRKWGLVLALAAMTLFAFGSHLRFGPWEIADLTAAYSWIDPVPSIFRSSGRFIWPLHYICILAAIVCLVRSIGRPRIATLALLVAVVVQLGDSWHVYAAQNVIWMALQNDWNPLRSPAWSELGRDYAEIRLVPPYVHDATCLPSSYPPYFYIPFAYVAALQHMRINSAHLSRQPQARITAACEALDREIAAGELDAASVYVVSDDVFRELAERHPGAARCRRIDGFNVCVRADRPHPPG